MIGRGKGEGEEGKGSEGGGLLSLEREDGLCCKEWDGGEGGESGDIVIEDEIGKQSCMDRCQVETLDEGSITDGE